MTDKIVHGINYFLGFVNSIPMAAWFAFGLVAASIPVVIAVTAAIKKRHFKKTATKLKTEFIVYNVVIWSFVLTIVDAVIANGAQVSAIFPALAIHWPQISAGAIVVHSFATAVQKYFRDRKKANGTIQEDLAAIPIPDELIKNDGSESQPQTQPPSSSLFQ